MDTIFDIGMYDGADTAYYLQSGYKVVAIEANPDLIKSAEKRFVKPISSVQLTCINAAISANGEPAELTICGMDPGSSTINAEVIANRQPAGTINIPGMTVNQLFE